uniref:Uncharacterized protein n=1 Tax=Chromera velia CCMP2878 TaxID=1169474 RepID=A0A0G4HR17_9ALVE|eukprot:Cvel_30361.t1-p1 / transcript=Cvel_30361.t1 / gene=Cvel_30361 / organism=Chromera_velia_CCMP2878 / gene_product=hypothetical protein / transcript_product=hypothetical protein / location=Cvel_scaffold4316:315-4146(-) / protein_length=463 / sequence_SO=supercontig / SO=protein_coding / is_pseudo=false
MAPKRTTKGLAAAASSGSRPQGGGRQVLRPQTLSSSSSAQNTRTGNRREAAAGTVAVQPSQTQRRSGRLAQTATSSSSSSSSSSSAASKETVKAKPKQPTSSPSSSASASTAAPSSSSAAAAVGVRVRGRDAPADRRSGRLAAVEKEKARRVKEASAAKAEEKGGKKRVEPTETEKEQQAKKRKEEGEGKGATSNGKEETDEASALSCAPIDFLSRRLFGASSRSLPIGMNGGHLPASHGHTRVGGLCDQNFRRRRAQEELKENLDAMEVLYVDRMSSEGDKVFSFRTSDRRPLVYSGGKGGTLTAYKMTADSSDDALRIYPVHQAHVTAVREVDVSGLFPLLVSSSYDGTVKVTDLQHGIAFNTLESFSGEVCKVTALDVSGDRQRIAYANDKGQMVVSAPNEAGWKGQATRMKTGLRHKVHQGKAGYLSFSPTCSHYLASGPFGWLAVSVCWSERDAVCFH